MRLPVLFLLMTFTPGIAQITNHVHAGAAEKPAQTLPPPLMIAGVGSSHLTITTSSPEAQRWFDQGLSLLHCFWDFEALRAFREAARLDPACAMCQWGIHRAMEFGGSSEDELNPVVGKMKELAPKASDREQRYIRSIVESAGKKGEEASKAYRREMEALIYHYPDDLDAQLFLALSMEGGFDEKGDPRPGELYAMAMLRDILRNHPDNAAANHYWIHAVEGSEHPEWALESAERLGNLTPGSGHMVHMPGHIFYRTGNYEQARKCFLNAIQVDEAYLRAQKLQPRDDWNYSHNLSYLIANSAEEGRAKEAVDYAAKLEPLAHDPAASDNPGFYVVQIGGTKPRLAIRFGQWREAIDHPVDFGIPEDKLPLAAKAIRDGMVIYARAMLALDHDDLDGGARASDQLDALLWRLMRDRTDQADKTDKNLERLNHTAERVEKILSVASKELAGNVASHSGNYDRAKVLLKQAVEAEKNLGYSEPPMYSRPALESLGYAAIRAGKWDQARDAFRQVLAARPKSGFGYYGIALAYEKEGNRTAASQAYAEFLDAWKYADEDLELVRAARAAKVVLDRERSSR
ncbi:MAG TPA: tetratricopeptide repeat protein [Bryobacteraceae bacterium]|nr:tetratricopeptide repeat protein [Bryobacteraceae bacterium]